MPLALFLVTGNECLCLPALAKQKGKNTEVPAQENFNKGVDFYKRRNFDSAIDAFLQSIYFARNGYNPEAYFWLGKSYMAKHEDAKAIDAFNKHLEQNIRPSPDAHYYLGEVLLRNNRLDEAETQAGLAQANYFGKGEKAHNLHGKVLVKKGDLSAARWEFEQALGEAPWTYTEAWENYAETFMLDKSWPQAFNQYSALLAAADRLKGLDVEKCYLNVGQCVLAKGDHQGAIDDFHKVLTINPANADAHLQLGMIFDAENHISSAIEEYSQFVRCSTDARKTEKAKERIAMLQQKVQPPSEPVAKPSLNMRIRQEQSELARPPQSDPSDQSAQSMRSVQSQSGQAPAAAGKQKQRQPETHDSGF